QITAHEVNIPYESRVAYLNRLEEDLYRDFQALNVEKVSSGNQTATAINAAYQPFDTKADAFEYQVLQFWKRLAPICGVDAPITFTRNRVANRQEEVNMILACAEYLDEETIIRQLCNILGIADAADSVIEARAARDVERLAYGEAEDETEEPEDELEAEG
ncbi:MAG: phage portal protein, partial [Bacteroidales bacterium]|nr:phage portal protein [Bacteroidales bacterium]